MKHHDFMCRCGDDSYTQCQEVVAAARAIYDENKWEDERYPHNDLAFVSWMLFMLALEGEISVGADQWAGVFYKPFEKMKWDDEARKSVKDEEAKQYESSAIQCDDVVDGIAATFLLYHEEGLFDR